MKFILLVCLGFAIKVPGYLGSWATLYGGRDPDWISSPDAKEVIYRHIKADGRRDCPHGNSGEYINHKQMTQTTGI